MVQGPPQHLHMSGPTGLFARTLIPRAVVLVHPSQHLQMPSICGPRHTSIHPTDSGAPAPTSTAPGARPKPPSGVLTRLLIPLAAVLPKPLQQLQMPALSGPRTRAPEATSTPPGALP
jgi:hypothetical protein